MDNLEDALAMVLEGGPNMAAQGPFVEDEYEQAMRMLEQNFDMEERLFSSSIFRMQYNLVYVGKNMLDRVQKYLYGLMKSVLLL